MRQQGYPIMGVVVADLPLAKEPKDLTREEYATPAVATNWLNAIGPGSTQKNAFETMVTEPWFEK